MKTTLFALLVSAVAFAEVGKFPAGEKYEAPADHAPANVSRMYSKAIERAGSVDLPAAGDSSMIVWTIPVRGVRAERTKISPKLITPTGASLESDDNGSLERGLRRFRFDSSEVGIDLPRGEQEVVHILRAEAANYRLDVPMPEGVRGVMVVAAEPESRLVLSTWAAPLSRQPGQPVTLRAELRDGDEPVAGARVIARLASPAGRASDAIQLADQGHGIYSATLAELPTSDAGAWQVRFDADGRTSDGRRFLRTGAGELVAERGTTRLISAEAKVTGDVLRITVKAEALAAGMFRFDAIVFRGDAALAWAEEPKRIERGSNDLVIEIPLSVIGAAEGLRADVRLLGLDQIGVAGRLTLDVQ